MDRNKLTEKLCYSPETGLFTWRNSPSNFLKSGANAGCANTVNGYVFIKIDGVNYKAHRLAWLYVNGSFPSGRLDHVNGAKDDNRIANLRLATASENGQNLRKPTAKNTTGFLGVSFIKRTGKFQAMIKHSGKNRYLGSFDCAESASDAYLSAKRKFHSFCTI